jgi:hypothetical protein
MFLLGTSHLFLYLFMRGKNSHRLRRILKPGILRRVKGVVRLKGQTLWSSVGQSLRPGDSQMVLRLSCFFHGFLVLMRGKLLQNLLYILLGVEPGTARRRARAREKDCRYYDLQPVKEKEWILCSRGTLGNAESFKKKISSSPHFFKII